MCSFCAEIQGQNEDNAFIDNVMKNGYSRSTIILLDNWESSQILGYCGAIVCSEGCV